jgi:hypothetical protein
VIWVLVGVVIVCLVGLVVLARQSSALAASNKAATVTLEDTKAHVATARQERDDTAARLAAAEAEVVAAHRATEYAEARANLAESGLAFRRQEMAFSVARAQLEALWSLACLEQGRAWRLTMALPLDPATPSGPDSLATAVEREIDRIREETGTPGEVAAALPDELGAGDAMVVLKALQGLMAVLTRYSDAFDLKMGVETGQMVATLTCEGFDGPDTVADEATALLEALRPAGGEIDVDRDAEGRLEARLTLPLNA